jgi:hypothetical protein
MLLWMPITQDHFDENISTLCIFLFPCLTSLSLLFILNMQKQCHRMEKRRMSEDFHVYVREQTQPTALDVEVAKRVLLEHIDEATSPSTGLIEVSGILSRIERALVQTPGPIPPPFTQIDPDLHVVKAHIAGREALNQLHATGVLTAFGKMPDRIEDLWVRFYHVHGNQPYGPVYLPNVYAAYRLASTYQGQQRFRLAGGDIYLSSIQHALLPSRAVRCLRECGEAFRHGLYLSATMTVGAASESLWMELGQLVCDKHISGTPKLIIELNKPFPNISAIIEPTWNALLTTHDTLLKGIFGHDGERQKFRLYAERLRERRNYAMHHKDADEDEPWFTYDETGLLLLEATTYFNQFAELLTALHALP